MWLPRWIGCLSRLSGADEHKHRDPLNLARRVEGFGRATHWRGGPQGKPPEVCRFTYGATIATMSSNAGEGDCIS